MYQPYLAVKQLAVSETVQHVTVRNTMIGIITVLSVVLILLASPAESSPINKWLAISGRLTHTIMKYWKPIKKRNMVAMDFLITEMTDIFIDVMPEKSPLTSVDEFFTPLGLPIGYMCLADGYAGNWKTLKRNRNVECMWDSDRSVNVEVPYTVQDFNSGYGVFYLRLFSMTKKGTVNIHLGENKIIVGITFPSMINILDKVRGKEPCIVKMTKFEVPYLAGVHVELTSDGPTAGKLTTKILNFYFSRYTDILKQRLRQRVLYNAYWKMSKKNNSLCLSAELLEELRQLDLLKEKVYSEEFYKYCGENSGIEVKNKLPET